MNPENFHKNLKYQITQKGVTALELSCKTGLSRVTIISLVLGVREPSVKHLVIIATYFGIKLDELFN